MGNNEDLRSPLAKARDDFEQSEKCKESCRVITLIRDDAFDRGDIYLKNRLSNAFVAGWEACEKHKSTIDNRKLKMF
jgi:hypothetical protein